MLIESREENSMEDMSAEIVLYLAGLSRMSKATMKAMLPAFQKEVMYRQKQEPKFTGKTAIATDNDVEKGLAMSRGAIMLMRTPIPEEMQRSYSPEFDLLDAVIRKLNS